jgi:hypothetical protein
MNVELRYDEMRGCGRRKPGGLYLISAGPARPCGKLPCPLTSCPTCGNGIKFARGWTWVDADKLLMERPCNVVGGQDHERCALASQLFGMAGLLWIGEQFYKTPSDFLEEADRLGISRRIHAVPRGLALGKTWILLAHIKAVSQPMQTTTGTVLVTTPGIFRMFKPTAIEYVLKGDEAEEELERMESRGITLVKVQPKDLLAPATVTS